MVKVWNPVTDVYDDYPLDPFAVDSTVAHDTGDETIAGVKTFTSDPIIPDEVYGVGWNGSLEPPTKNAVYDKIETIGGGGTEILFRQTTLTNKTSWSGTGSFEQWGTEEAVCAQADAPTTVDVIADCSGYMDSDSSSNNMKLKVEVSVNGGSTWTGGNEVFIRNAAGDADERFPIYAFCMVSGATVTGDIQARVSGEVAVNTTGRSLNNGAIKLIVKTAE